MRGGISGTSKDKGADMAKVSVVQTEAEPMSIVEPRGFDPNKFKTTRAGNARVHRPTLLRVLAALTGAHGVMPV